jgi:3-ketosteroid 9alpha-monooxygenase subunit B
MALSEPTAHALGAQADHGFYPLRVSRVVRETADASSFVLEVPGELAPLFAYEAGQFCNFRVQVGDHSAVRCYSMSSSPVVDAEMKVTVKRVPGGAVSNWMNDQLAAGDTVEVGRPAGLFRLGTDTGDLVAYSAGSGITPVFSLIKAALSTTSRRVRLVYANRDRDSVIFHSEVEALSERFPDRFELTHHLDVDKGFIGPDVIRRTAGAANDTEFYVCGPEPFMDIVEETLLADGADSERIHVERFTPERFTPEPEPPPPFATTNDTMVTIELDGRTETTEYQAGTTILQTARQLGMSPPFSCEAGSCATCMARVLEGTTKMHANNALTADEVEEGWVLTCQALPTSPLVRVAYGYGEG